MNMAAIYEQLFNVSIHRYKQKNSTASHSLQERANQAEQHSVQGGIFAVRQKEDFASNGGVKGMILTSIESLLVHSASLSHFTPNPYVSYRYTNHARTHVTGFSDDHLLQINTFVVDIDTKKHSVEDILLTTMDNSIGLPTLIVESPRGYQLYFMLETPFYLSTDNKARSLHIAKRIAQNIKQSLRDIDADEYCNDFGFFRVPTEQNIRFCQLNHVYNIASLIDWSIRQDDNIERPLYIRGPKVNNLRLTEQPWFQAIIQTNNIRGQKGQLGRNNAIFTLALACYHDQWSFEKTYDLLDEWNSTLQSPLKDSEVRTICRSAYSGKYNGPQKMYIEQLIVEYVDASIELPQLAIGSWYKHKKERKDRVRSHLEEWEADVIAFIEARTSIEEPFVQLSQSEVCQALGIAKSTLNKLLNASSTIIRKVSGAGRGAITQFSTTTLFKSYLVTSFIANKKSSTFIPFAVAQLYTIIAPVALLPLLSFIHETASQIERRRRHHLLVHSA